MNDKIELIRTTAIIYIYITVDFSSTHPYHYPYFRFTYFTRTIILYFINAKYQLRNVRLFLYLCNIIIMTYSLKMNTNFKRISYFNNWFDSLQRHEDQQLKFFHISTFTSKMQAPIYMN